MGKPLLSIITVCYQAEAEIERTIQSVLNQTFTDYEYIFKDGGSADRTNEIINSYKPAFAEKGIAVTHVSSKDGGLYRAMNEATALAQGEWLSFLNAGDYYFGPRVLEQVFSRHYEEETVIYGNTVEVEAGVPYHLEGDISYIREKSLICHQSSFIRADWMKETGYNPRYRIAADYDFFLKTFMAGRKFCKLNQYISVFIKDGVSSTNELQRVQETETVRESYRLIRFDSEEYQQKIRMAQFKQLILDYTPRAFSDGLKKIRRKMRHMDRKADLTGEDTFFK